MEEKKRKCTLKERRQAAQLLAARENSPKIEQKHLEAVGAMSDLEVLNFLDSELLPAMDPGQNKDALQVEEIKPGAGGVVSSDDIRQAAKNTIQNYLMNSNLDAATISPLQWSACCLACGRFFNHLSLFREEQKNSFISNNMNAVNYNAIAAAVPAWLELCIYYNKAPLISDFCYFCGVSKQWFYAVCEGLTPGGIDLAKLLHQIQEDGLNSRILNSKESPIGAMFLQKCINGYSETQTIKHEYITGSGSASALPVFASSGPDHTQNDKNGPF